MTDKKIQILDSQKNNLFPATKAELVTNKAGANLGDVEAGAQVNKIEKIKVNGVELAIKTKEVDIELPASAEYTIAKAETAEAGMAATYQLTKDGVAIGAKINIPKDMVVQSGTVETVTTADKPVAGFKKGDKYIDLVLANAENSHIYILVSDLVDTYKEGNGISISGDTIYIDDSVVATKEDLNTKQDSLTLDQIAALDSGITEAEFTSMKTNISNLENSIYTMEQQTLPELAGEVTTTKNALDGKADKATTLAGYGIVDALTYVEISE